MTAKIFMGNAFSLQMMSADEPHQITTYPMTIGQVRAIYRDSVPVTSAVGHADTARIVSDLLGVEVPAQRISLHLEKGDLLIVAQIYGGRLPEGSTTLPEGFDLRFVGVKVES